MTTVVLAVSGKAGNVSTFDVTGAFVTAHVAVGHRDVYEALFQLTLSQLVFTHLSGLLVCAVVWVTNS